MTVSDKLTVTAVGDICLGGLLPREFIDLPEKISAGHKGKVRNKGTSLR